jgi:hypothetical protein
MIDIYFLSEKVSRRIPTQGQFNLKISRITAASPLFAVCF